MGKDFPDLLLIPLEGMARKLVGEVRSRVVTKHVSCHRTHLEYLRGKLSSATCKEQALTSEAAMLGMGTRVSINVEFR